MLPFYSGDTLSRGGLELYQLFCSGMFLPLYDSSGKESCGFLALKFRGFSANMVPFKKQ